MSCGFISGEDPVMAKNRIRGSASLHLKQMEIFKSLWMNNLANF